MILTLTLPEAIELVAFLSVQLDDLKPGAPISLLRGVEDKLKDQITCQCTHEQMIDAMKDLEIQSLLGRTA